MKSISKKLLLLSLLLETVLAGAQTGFNIVQKGTGSGTAASASIVDATQFTGSDMCAKINAAWIWAQTPLASGGAGFTSATIDARGITGPAQTCAGTPFPLKISGINGNNASGILLLGNVVITTSVTWNIPSLVHVEGIGVNALNPSNFQSSANTVIRANSTAVSPVVQLGYSNQLTFHVQLRNLTVDANGAAIGVLNNGSQEGTVVEDVNVVNASSHGILIQDNGTSGIWPGNSGPYRNINVQYNSNCSSSSCGTNTVGIGIENFTGNNEQTAIRGIDNVTVSGAGTSGQTIGSCIRVVGIPVQVSNSHVEFCTPGLQIGGTSSGNPTQNVIVQNVSANYPRSSWEIEIQNANDVILTGITSNAVDILNDLVTTNQITQSIIQPYYLGFYMLGDAPTQDGTTPAVISTSATIASGPNAPNLTWVAPADLDVTNKLIKGSGTFKIDDPVDPTHKYLYHSFVESPDMMNVYNGLVTTDKHGMATVIMPAYFEALNKDFRYQLTPIGSLAQATIAEEITDNQFIIRTSKPGVKVSWQVTGIRNDGYANANRIKVEEEKPLRERGHYLHSEVAPETAK